MSLEETFVRLVVGYAAGRRQTPATTPSYEADDAVKFAVTVMAQMGDLQALINGEKATRAAMRRSLER